mmetsp:Transcript_37538/g.52108  ORF Transcript_37538/g.52108 Transcript_37538/m.52108 type:complete len:228 (+) Transcript_37538:74-757(+)|eukprot:CAMPEP_0196589486 /NCGR_PEP_ID=MMETSP1081-20130531/63689_1 /TAXON_ID=36882 /ORGANISM="Pyramimonas amylifera, Strain CCMP720" /LENGTH=227 /DNA_ID=CAMNT_0041912299 /DNA_START=57 /DNA_END=740 /DNA_ORIENTATION=-
MYLRKYGCVLAVAVLILAVFKHTVEGQRPSVEELRAPLYKGIKCAACLAFCNETEKTMKDMLDKHISTEPQEHFGAHYDSEFHSRLTDSLDKLCVMDNDKRSKMSDKYKLSQHGADLISHAFDTAEKESTVHTGPTAMKIDRGPYNKVVEGLELLSNSPEDWQQDQDMQWRNYVRDIVTETCGVVGDSEEFLDKIEGKKKFSVKSHRKLCQKLSLCPKPPPTRKTEF